MAKFTVILLDNEGKIIEARQIATMSENLPPEERSKEIEITPELRQVFEEHREVKNKKVKKGA